MSETDGARIDRETRLGLGEVVLTYLTEESPDWLMALEGRVRAEALREAAALMRTCKDIGHWNLRDLHEPDVAYSPDRWLEVLADIEAEKGAGDE